MDYRDISSYSDEHVAEKIQELEADDNFHKYIANLIFPVAVSYTHLTLPTIYSV